MRRLIVLYDPSCRLCRNARRWLEHQPKLVPLVFVPAGTRLARERFPELGAGETLAELHVVGDRGEVYRGAKAWVMCLWALRDYRGWSVRLGRPEMLPHSRRFVRWLSKRRHRLGRCPEGLQCPGRPRQR